MMPSRRTLAAVLAAAVLPAVPRAETITGSVDFTGAAPTPAKIDRSADAFCAKTPGTDDSVVVKNKKLVNVWVHVVKGAPDATAPDGAPEVVVDQSACTYRPRVQAAVVGQKVVAKNTDPILHNVHTYLGKATLFNKGMPDASAKPITPHWTSSRCRYPCSLCLMSQSSRTRSTSGKPGWILFAALMFLYAR